MNISAQHLHMVYPSGKRALGDVSVTLESPSLVGLLGPNGAGKTTLMKLLVAGLMPTGGAIEVDGTPLAQCERALKARLGYLPQRFGLFGELTVWQFLDYMAALKGIVKSRDAIAQAIEKTNLTDMRKRRIRTLSGGQRQRVGIAQALLGSPDLLIFDEPTVGLDPEERISFRNLFSETAQDRILLLSTHIIEDVQAICNRLIVIDEGAIRFDGTPEALIASAQGHVGIMDEMDAAHPGLHITSRVNMARGIVCRVVGDVLPPAAQPAEATLEDAYIYLLAGKEPAACA